MAKISSFKVDADAIEDGQWIALGGDFDDVEIQTRGLTDKYHDATASKQRKAAQGFNGDTERLPIATRRRINAECFIKHVLLDPPVKNLTHDDGKEVSPDQFREMLLKPEFTELLAGCYAAARRVGQINATDMDAAAKN